jgi:uncharacterized protein (DUF1778 family)
MAAQDLLVKQSWLTVGAESFERFANELDAPPQANAAGAPAIRRPITAPRTSIAAIPASTSG